MLRSGLSSTEDAVDRIFSLEDFGLAVKQATPLQRAGVAWIWKVKLCSFWEC